MQILLERGLGLYDLKISLKTENSFCCLLSFAGFFFFLSLLNLLHVLCFGFFGLRHVGS